MKFPFKVACLLLSLMLLLNGAGFAAMLGCDQQCCEASARPLAAQGNSMSCHDGEEMGQASDAALQLENGPVEAPPLNFVHCDREITSASLLIEKTDFRYDLIAATSSEQILGERKGYGGETASLPSSPPLSKPITLPLRN